MNKIVEAFDQIGRDASYHFADDSGKEWHHGYQLQRLALAMFNAYPAYQDAMRDKASKFLWSLNDAIDSARKRGSDGSRLGCL